MEYQDYYQTLGVPRAASQADIKKAFRKLAREHHPDKKPGDKVAEQRFKAINEANAVLSDPDKRKKYDRLGKDWEAYSRAGVDPDAPGSPFAAGGPFGPAPGGGGRSGRSGNVRYEFRTSGSGGDDFSDFFRVFFGGDAGSAGAAGSSPAANRSARRGGGAGPSFEDILAGMGLGGAGSDGSAGAGSRTGSRPAAGATQRVAGPTAEGVAEIDLDEAYRGTTRLVEIDGRRLEITIPRGADTGTKIKLSGQGPNRGDLVVTTRIRPHAVFNRNGADLERDLPITLREALLGSEVPVATLKGKVLLRIPAGTQNGHRFRLTGQGMPRLRGEGHGDLYARVRVVLPTDLDESDVKAARAFLDKVDQPDPRTSGRPDATTTS
jgi:DnaJ-class molecular chaperone